MADFNKFDFICDTVDNGIILLDKSLKVHFWNNWLETRTNIKADAIQNQQLQTFYPNINIKTLQRKINAALTLNSTTFYNTKVTDFLLDIRLSKVTNKVFAHMRQNVTIAPYSLDQGMVIIYVYDNTALCEVNYKLEHAKNDLEDSFEELNLLLNTTMEAVFLFDNEQCVNCNDVALELFGYANKKEIINKEIYDFIDEKTQKSVTSNKEKPFEVLMKKKDGSKFYALIRLKDTQLKNKIFKILTIMDISELKSKDRLLAEQTKMAALGEMIGNIAHQWRQPLSTISTAASGIKLQKAFDLLTDELLNESIDSIMRNSTHLSQTIEDFKEFLKGDKEKVIFNLKQNLEKNLKLVEGMLKSENIEVIFICENNIDLLNYPNELTQAFLNIINNAKDAFNETTAKNTDRYLFVDAYLKETSVFIEITDNAHGINNKIIDKIFEPYFTTKHKSIGTGLGLYMTHQIITLSMKGSISVHNKKYRYNNHNYKGACFTIELPL